MVQTIEGNIAQHRCGTESLSKWFKKDCYTCSKRNMHIIAKFDHYPTTQELWDRLNISYDVISATRLPSMMLKFEITYQDPKHTMVKHLRIISAMIHDLESASNNHNNDQQILPIIQSPDSWEVLKLALTHNKNIKRFDDSSCHLELEEAPGSEQQCDLYRSLGNTSSCGESVEDRGRLMGNKRNGNML